MKDYKQKYKQALENIKKIKVANKSNKELVDFIEYKYPELKESKALFKKGDWVTNGIDFTFQVISIEDNYYLRSDDYLIDTETADEKFRLWTIQDAKNGDILAFDDKTIVIFKDLYKSNTFHSYCHVEKGAFNISQDGMPDWWSWWGGKGFRPATKEQRATLMKAMADAGYTFDFEKKELKKIEQKLADKIEPKFHEGDKLVSTKNPRLTYKVLEIGNINELGNPEYKVEIFTDGKAKNPRNIHYIECYKVEEWAKLIEQKSTWSEEDEEMIKGLNNCLFELEEKNGWRYTYVNDKDVELDKIRNWLKSLKERYTWKPSEEQIIELHQAISGCSYDIEPLIEIEEYLKKLREE